MELISAERIKSTVAESLASLHGGYTAEDIRTVLHDLGTTLIKKMIDVDAEAQRIVRDDYKATLAKTEGCLMVPVSALHTVSNIDKLRTRTGAGLTEARDAIRKAMHEMYYALTTSALRSLEKTNVNAPDKSRMVIDSADWPTVIAPRYVKPNDEIPF